MSGVEDLTEVDVEANEGDVMKLAPKKETDSDYDSETEDEDEDENETEDENDESESDEEEELGIKTTEKQAFADFSEDEDENDDEDEHYLQKFDETTNSKIITDFHPELQIHNYDEVDSLSRIIRDQNGNIIDPFHKTLPFITRYEKARILGERAKQLNSGARPLIEVDPSIIDGYLIALKEFDEKKIPFIVKRPIPNGGCEYWKFSDLEVI